MARSTQLFLLFLAFLAVLLGYNYFVQPFADLGEKDEITVAPSPAPDTIPAWQGLSSSQKVAQLMAYPLDFDESVSSFSAQLDWVDQYRPGTVTLFGSDISVAEVEEIRSQVGAFMAVDHEGGTVQRLSGEGFTDLPSYRGLCALDEVEREQYLASSAAELSAAGINIIFGPTVDLASSSGVLAGRTCSSDPELTIQASLNWIEAFSEVNVLPVIKHFPGIGTVNVDLHRRFGLITLRREEVTLFQELMAQQPQLGVMTSHAGIKDSTVTGPCSLDADCLQDLENIYPQGLVISDALDMAAAGYIPDATTSMKLNERAQAALLAGNNMLVFGPRVTDEALSSLVSSLAAEYEVNDELREAIEASLDKIWRYKQVLK